MSTHSVAEAKNRLPELIDRALKGEGVVITRHGHPVVELKPVRPQHGRCRQKTSTGSRRGGLQLKNPKEDAGTLVSRMRDEEILNVYLDANVLVALFTKDDPDRPCRRILGESRYRRDRE